MIANGGALDLFEAHVHDSDNACAEGGGDDESEVSEMYGFAVEEVVGGFVMVGDCATMDFV